MERFKSKKMLVTILGGVIIGLAPHLGIAAWMVDSIVKVVTMYLVAQGSVDVAKTVTDAVQAGAVARDAIKAEAVK